MMSFGARDIEAGKARRHFIGADGISRAAEGGEAQQDAPRQWRGRTGTTAGWVIPAPRLALRTKEPLGMKPRTERA